MKKSQKSCLWYKKNWFVQFYPILFVLKWVVLLSKQVL